MFALFLTILRFVISILLVYALQVKLTMANVTGWKMEQPTASHIKYKNKSLKIPKGNQKL